MATSRRVRRKLHRQSLIDVLYGLSVSYIWRARFHEAGLGVELLVDATTLDDVPPAVNHAVRQGHLRYRAARAPHEWTHGWRGYEGYVMFRLRAEEFPGIVAFSANNPATIHGRPQRSPAPA
jgi:hypothetical protein